MARAAVRGAELSDAAAVAGVNPATSVGLRPLAGGFACPSGTGT